MEVDEWRANERKATATLVSVVVGYQSGAGGDEAIELGASLADALGTSLVLVIATPKPWTTPSMARVDAEFAEYARRYGDDAETAARAHLQMRSPDTVAEFRRISEGSVSRSLHKVLSELDAQVLVLGTSHGDDGGRMSLGVTTSRLMHSSSVPLALAPKGYKCARISGITCAYSGDAQSHDVVVSARALAETMSVPLRVATFGVRPADMFPPEVGFDVERGIMAAWQEQMSESMQALVEAGVIDDGVPTLVSTGDNWDAAFDAIGWSDGEILAIGTTPRDSVKRVFLGSRAAKIVAAATVPAIIFPG
jgi:nucleotide-binding universal stress UspA family protein